MWFAMKNYAIFQAHTYSFPVTNSHTDTHDDHPNDPRSMHTNSLTLIRHKSARQSRSNIYANSKIECDICFFRYSKLTSLTFCDNCEACQCVCLRGVLENILSIYWTNNILIISFSTSQTI